MIEQIMGGKLTRGELVEDLTEFAEDLGKTPTIREMREFGPHSGNRYQTEFGSWNKALEEAGFSPNVTHNITREQILEDIERVAGVLGKPPTLNEMDKYGEFSKLTYQNKLGSYVAVLEELGFEPTTSQYNFSNQDAPENKQATKNVRKLRNDGPTPASELPQSSTSVSDKRHGLAKFSVNTGQTGNKQSEAIYYLFDDHQAEEVIRKFIEVNPQILDARSRKAIVGAVGRHGKEWSTAVKRVLDDLGIE